MNGQHYRGVLACLLIACASTAASAAGPLPIGLERLAVVELPGAEVVAWDPAHRRVWATCSVGLVVLRAEPGGHLAVEFVLDPAKDAGLPTGMRGQVTHVAVDPVGRNVVCAAVVPEHSAAARGRVVFLDAGSGRAIGNASVGFHPDAVAFSPDGHWLVVANEGEPVIGDDGAVVDQPGSVSIADLRAVADSSSIAHIDFREVLFIGPVVDRAVTDRRESRFRVRPESMSDPSYDIEPESVAVHGGRAFVSLQENNAVAVIDLQSGALDRLVGLGAPLRRLDGSRHDGVRIETEIPALRMPDQLAVLTYRDRVLLITADEGDSRGLLGELPEGLADTATLDSLAMRDRLSAGVVANKESEWTRLNELRVCSHSGPLDDAGRLLKPAALGARSVSVWDATTLEPIGDTGSQFEETVSLHAPDLFNASWKHGQPVLDARSPIRGPEPEGVVATVLDGRPLAFVTFERPGAVAVIDLSLPEQPRVVGFDASARDGLLEPEGLVFVPADQNPTGRPLLIVAFEGSGHIAVYAVKSAD